MSIPAKCESCGLSYIATSILIKNSVGVTFSGGSETCPRCGGRAQFQSGVYDFIGDGLGVLRRASRTEVQKLRDIISAATTGEIDYSDAIRQSDEIRHGFGPLLAAALQYGIPGILIALIALYLQFASMKDDERSSADMMELLRQQAQTDELLLKEFQRLNELQSTSPPPAYSAPKPPTTQQRPNEVSRPNRHERRAAAVRTRSKRDP